MPALSLTVWGTCAHVTIFSAGPRKVALPAHLTTTIPNAMDWNGRRVQRPRTRVIGGGRGGRGAGRGAGRGGENSNGGAGVLLVQKVKTRR